METTITIEGIERPGWACRYNRQVTSDSPNLKTMEGCNPLSRELGAMILGR